MVESSKQNKDNSNGTNSRNSDDDSNSGKDSNDDKVKSLAEIEDGKTSSSSTAPISTASKQASQSGSGRASSSSPSKIQQSRTATKTHKQTMQSPYPVVVQATNRPAPQAAPSPKSTTSASSSTKHVASKTISVPSPTTFTSATSNSHKLKQQSAATITITSNSIPIPSSSTAPVKLGTTTVIGAPPSTNTSTTTTATGKTSLIVTGKTVAGVAKPSLSAPIIIPTASTTIGDTKASIGGGKTMSTTVAAAPGAIYVGTGSRAVVVPSLPIPIPIPATKSATVIQTKERKAFQQTANTPLCSNPKGEASTTMTTNATSSGSITSSAKKLAPATVVGGKPQNIIKVKETSPTNTAPSVSTKENISKSAKSRPVEVAGQPQSQQVPVAMAIEKNINPAIAKKTVDPVPHTSSVMTTNVPTSVTPAISVTKLAPSSPTTSTTTATPPPPELIPQPFPNPEVKTVIRDILTLLQKYGPLSYPQLEFHLPPYSIFPKRKQEQGQQDHSSSSNTTNASFASNNVTSTWSIQHVLDLLVVLKLINIVKEKEDVEMKDLQKLNDPTITTTANANTNTATISGTTNSSTTRYCFGNGIPRGDVVYPWNVMKQIEKAKQERDDSFARIKVLKEFLNINNKIDDVKKEGEAVAVGSESKEDAPTEDASGKKNTATTKSTIEKNKNAGDPDVKMEKDGDTSQISTCKKGRKDNESSTASMTKSSDENINCSPTKKSTKRNKKSSSDITPSQQTKESREMLKSLLLKYPHIIYDPVYAATFRNFSIDMSAARNEMAAAGVGNSSKNNSGHRKSGNNGTTGSGQGGGRGSGGKKRNSGSSGVTQSSSSTGKKRKKNVAPTTPTTTSTAGEVSKASEDKSGKKKEHQGTDVMKTGKLPKSDTVELNQPSTTIRAGDKK